MQALSKLTSLIKIHKKLDSESYKRYPGIRPQRLKPSDLRDLRPQIANTKPSDLITQMLKPQLPALRLQKFLVLSLIPAQIASENRVL